MIHVQVTKDDILTGERRDCFRCPVAVALARATGDTEANVYVRDWALYLEAWNRSILAPFDVRQFVDSFDEDELRPEPFEFELPDQEDPQWQERCYYCEELYASAELDNEGVCESCREIDE